MYNQELCCVLFLKNCLIYYVSEGLGISDVSGLIEEQSAGSGFARKGA